VKRTSVPCAAKGCSPPLLQEVFSTETEIVRPQRTTARSAKLSLDGTFDAAPIADIANGNSKPILTALASEAFAVAA